MAIAINQTEQFIQYLKQFGNVSEDEIARCFLPVVKIREFKKRQFITQSGEVESYINYIQKGLVRKYYLHGKEERIVQLANEGNLVSCLESLITGQPTEYFVEAIEPTTVISVVNEDLEKMYLNNHAMERIGRLISVHSLVLLDRRQLSMIKLSPRERFLNFMENSPDILQRVPQKYIASYLNIKPETFSRFKHLIRAGNIAAARKIPPES